MNLDSGPRKDFPRTEWTIGRRVRKKQSFQHEVKGEVKKSVTLYGPRSSARSGPPNQFSRGSEIPLCLES